MRPKRTWIACSALLVVLGLMGCRPNAPIETGRLQVVTTLFPLYDFCRQIAGDKAEVTLLLPPGVEPHGFEPRPADIVRISKADLFVYTGPFMEPWVDGMLNGISSRNLIVIDASTHIELLTEGDEGRGAKAEDDPTTREGHHHIGGKDPHIWLDPILAQQIVQTIAEGFAHKDPANRDLYLNNARAYDEKLGTLDAKIRATLAKCRTRTIIYGGHFAFGYFAKRYGLEPVSPYEGFSPDAEPTPRRIVEVIEALKKAGSRYIYYEELLEPRVAGMMAESTGAELLLLHGAHNISREELEKGVTYMAIMEGNLERLKLGLDYHE